MIVSYNWLKTLIPFKESPEDLSKLLTNTGLEVEKLHKIESIKGGLNGLIVGEVVTCEVAENSDKLKLTTVNVGGENNLPIVCGAPNVAAGQKVVVAPVGATIYPSSGESFKIKKAKIRGHVSEGMLCAEDEIGLGSSHDGIMTLKAETTVGTAVSDLFNLKEDFQIEIGLTPNRGDAASHLGTARDIQAMTEATIQLPSVTDITNDSPCPISIQVEDPNDCPRYSGILLKNIQVGESPDWLKQRLLSIEINPINNVVDTTNFVLHELGQPIHAFDAEKINGNILVRKPRAGEKITTLDEVERNLAGHELLIADDQKPLALAGVFGGLDSGVSENTTTVFIESAYFNPAVIRKSAKSHGLNTDASFRYERGCDPNITLYALKRVVSILEEVANAEVASGIVDFYPNAIANNEITFNSDWLNKFCGISLTNDEIVSILKRLEIEVKEINDSNDITVSVAPYRSDVLRPVDIAEEVLRIYGFNQVVIPKRISMTPSVEVGIDHQAYRHKISDFLVSKGFYETMSNSQSKPNSRVDAEPVTLLNPLSIDQSVMRTDMLDGIMSSIAFNLNRKNKDLLFFEFGKTYAKNEDTYLEYNQIILACTGFISDKNWTSTSQSANYYYLKGVFESMAERLGLPIKKLMKDVSIQSLSTALKKEFGIKQDVYYAVVDWDGLSKRLEGVKFKLEDIPVFPVVSRDLSIVLNQDVEYSAVERIVKETAGQFFKQLTLFDVYEGKNIEAGKKSYAITVQLYDAKQTMTDERIEKIMSKMMTRLENEVKALIRK